LDKERISILLSIRRVSEKKRKEGGGEKEGVENPESCMLDPKKA